MEGTNFTMFQKLVTWTCFSHSSEKLRSNNVKGFSMLVSCRFHSDSGAPEKFILYFFSAWELVEMRVSRSLRETWEPCAWCKPELLINFFFHKLKLKLKFIKVKIKYFFILRHYFHTMLAYCPCLISHSTAIYHFRRVPKMLPNKRFGSVRGIFNGNTGIFVILAACCFSSSSSFPSPSLGSGRLDLAKAHYCPHRSQIEVWIAHKSRETDF